MWELQGMRVWEPTERSGKPAVSQLAGLAASGGGRGHAVGLGR